MGEEGLEPSISYEPGILSPIRIPIPTLARLFLFLL